MKKLFFYFISIISLLFAQSCKEDEVPIGCGFINYNFYVEFVDSEGNPIVTKAMEPTDFSIKCIKPQQEYNCFRYRMDSGRGRRLQRNPTENHHR